MMTSEWTPPAGRPRDADLEVCGYPPARDAGHGYARALEMAYRDAPADLPDDLLKLLARLN